MLYPNKYITPNVPTRDAGTATLGRSALNYGGTIQTVGSTNEGIYGIDSQGRCTFLNRAAARMLGYTRYEALGRNMHRLIHHSREDRSKYPEAECPIFRRSAACALPYRCSLRSGSRNTWPAE